MGKGVNRVTLIGNAGADTELRQTGNGTAIASMRLATSESWTDKQSGEKQERTEWHMVKLFGRLGEIAAEYVKKGRQVYIEGSLRTDKYEKDGIERYTTYIVANEMQLLGGAERQSEGAGNQRSGRQSSGQSDGNQGGNSYGNRSGNRSDNGNGYGNRGNGNGNGGGGDGRSQSRDDFNFEDEIPFDRR